MDTFIHLGIYILIVLSIYTIMIFILYSLAFTRPRKNDKNEFVIKKSNYIIKYIYRVNILRENIIYPKNICQLFWGLFFSLPSSMIGIIYVLIVVIFTIFFIFPVGLLLGFMPYLKNDKQNRSLCFHRYQRYGITDSKKWIAPYKIIILLSVIYFSLTTPLLSKGWNITWKFFWLIITDTILQYIFLTVVAIIILFVLYNVWKDSKSWRVIKQFVRDYKAKKCTLISIIE